MRTPAAKAVDDALLKKALIFAVVYIFHLRERFRMFLLSLSTILLAVSNTDAVNADAQRLARQMKAIYFVI
jgi:hypothetical protein